LLFELPGVFKNQFLTKELEFPLRLIPKFLNNKEQILFRWKKIFRKKWFLNFPPHGCFQPKKFKLIFHVCFLMKSILRVAVLLEFGGEGLEIHLDFLLMNGFIHFHSKLMEQPKISFWVWNNLRCQGYAP